MNNSVNFTTPEASVNSTTQSIGLLESLEICAYIINFLVGVPTHSYVICLIITGTGSGVASEFFNLNLSICEIGNSLNCLLFVLSNWFSSVFTLLFFLMGLSVNGRPLFQCLMCVERYMAVVHPVTFLKYKPLRYRVICCTVTWIITFGSCLWSMLFFVSIDAHTWLISMQFLLFLSIQLFCFVAVLRALKQSGPGEREREREVENHTKRRAFYLILITTANMVIIYVPMTISALFTSLTNLNTQEVWSPSVICFVLAGFVQPVLYLHRNGKLFCICSP